MKRKIKDDTENCRVHTPKYVTVRHDVTQRDMTNRSGNRNAVTRQAQQQGEEREKDGNTRTVLTFLKEEDLALFMAVTASDFWTCLLFTTSKSSRAVPHQCCSERESEREGERASERERERERESHRESNEEHNA